MKKDYSIEVDCANCALEMEEIIKKVPHVKNASVNYMMKSVNIEFEDGINDKELLNEINDELKKADDDMKIFM